MVSYFERRKKKQLYNCSTSHYDSGGKIDRDRTETQNERQKHEHNIKENQTGRMAKGKKGGNGQANCNLSQMFSLKPVYKYRFCADNLKKKNHYNSEPTIHQHYWKNVCS